MAEVAQLAKAALRAHVAEINPWNPHKGGRESTLQSCLLTSTHQAWIHDSKDV